MSLLRILVFILNTTFLSLLGSALIAIESALENRKASCQGGDKPLPCSRGEMLRRIAEELKRHAPFTALGTATGIVIMVIIVLGHVSSGVSHTIFYTLHPIHVVLSALVTTAMYMRYRKGKIWVAILIGWTGSVGIATISDAIIPYLGGSLLHVQMEFHVPFMEEWWINFLALAGVAIGYWKQVTRVPHFGHVLLSTWASLFYFTAFGIANWIPLVPFIFLFLFLAVWIPCCTSDIVYPLLFSR